MAIQSPFDLVADILYPEPKEGEELWVPMAHQVPPENDDWDLWIIWGGRGVGKTDGCANYLDQHVNGPPCDTRLPGGHRPAIIAPTLGDAIDSCVNGPSGLRGHNSDVRSVQRTGGTYVIWPNGTEAKLFGAHTPEDVERLRAGGNRSLLVGTLISTDRGRVPIEQVTTADRVWTSKGLRPVIKSWGHGKRDIWTIRTKSGRTLELTPDHKIWVDEKWKRTDCVVVGDRLSLWNGAVTAGNDLVPTGQERIKKAAEVERCFCTEKSTNNTLVSSLKDGTYTTRTKTSKTTIQKTSLLFLPLNIIWNIHHPALFMPQAGVHAPAPYQSERVSNAECNSKAVVRQDSVVANVGDDSVRPLPPRCSHALCAALISQEARSRIPLLVQDPVVTISHGNTEGETWDLCIAGEHEFIANDLLVANCIDWCEEIAAWRYLKTAWQHMRYGLRVGPHPRIIGSTTPKPRKFLISLLTDPKTVTTRAKTEDNPHLAQSVRDQLYKDYGGTRLGRQELEGELLTDTPGALATLDEMDLGRVADHPPLSRIVVAVDPAITKSLTSAEVGISVSGRVGDHVYQIADLSKKADVREWSVLVVQTALHYGAGLILYEANQGSDAIAEVLKRALADVGESEYKIPIKPVTAKQSKFDRALPLQQAVQQGRYHIVGSMPELEDQFTSWVPEAEKDTDKDADGSDDKEIKSPDRLDAAVHGYRELMGLGSGKGRTSGAQIAAARIG